MKAVAAFSLDLDLIQAVKARAKEEQIPVSRLVNNILAAEFKAEGDADE